jgi:hypothetical protein
MPLESITSTSKPTDLNESWPLASDTKSEGDDHIRNIKKVVKNFYTATGLGIFQNGAIPVAFGDTYVESPVLVENGGVSINSLTSFRFAFFEDLSDGTPTTTPFVRLGEDSSPIYYNTTGLATTTIQGVDSGISTSVIEGAITIPVNYIVTKIVLRGNATVSNVRLTIRDGGATGDIILQTAYDQELKAGGGFTLNGSGDTEINLKQYWPSVAGKVVWYSLERYDSVSGLVVKTGISVKGVLSGSFTPYLSFTGYPYTVEKVFTKKDNIARSLLHLTSTSPYSFGSSPATVVLVPVTLTEGEVYRWKIYALFDFASGNNPVATIQLKFGSHVVDDTGGDTIGSMSTSITPTFVSGVFEGTYIPAQDESVDLQVLVTGQSGKTIQMKKMIVSLEVV